MEKNVCDDVFLVKVADQFSNWEEIYVYFGISLEEAEQIKRNCSTYKEQKQTMLLLWKKFNWPNATIKNLKKIFSEVQNREVVDYINEITAVINIPATRPCLLTPEQLFLLKKEFLFRQYKRYVRDYEAIRHCDIARDHRFKDLFIQLISFISCDEDLLEVSTVTEHPDFRRIGSESIAKLSQFWELWPTALSVFYQTGNSPQMYYFMDQCRTAFDTFDRILPEKWNQKIRTKVFESQRNQQHPIGSIARDAQSILYSFIAELIGGDALKSHHEMVTKHLFEIESVNYTTRYLLPIYKWLFVLIHLIKSNQINAQTLKTTYHLILKTNRAGMLNNWSLIADILGTDVATELVEILPKYTYNSTKALENMHMETYAHIQTTVLSPWYVLLAVIGCYLYGFEVDFKKLQEKLSEFMEKEQETFSLLYQKLSYKMSESMTCELDQFKNDHYEIFGTTFHGSEVQKVYMQFLDTAVDYY